MVREIVKDIVFLRKKSEEAVQGDLAIGRDLQDTLQANRDRCVGMAANMIGFSKRIIILQLPFMPLVMFNPVIIKKEQPYEAEEGCLSLDGTRKCTRYRKITVTYLDFAWKKHNQEFSDRTAEIIQHECDHLEGIII